MSHLLSALHLSLPVLVGGAAHMAVVKADLLPSLRRPIDRARFGENKTWRGVVAMPLLTVLGVYLALLVEPLYDDALTVRLGGTSPIFLGLALGLAYVAFELPNSYMKRRLGIAPGKLPERNRFVFALVDQSDSAIGCMLVYALFVAPPWPVLLLLAFLGPAVHLAANLGLYSLGLRKEPL